MSWANVRRGSGPLVVVDVDPTSRSYGRVVGRVEMPNVGDELHHFGWNACSSALCPYAPHPHVERRYLVVPGLRSSRIHIIDIKPSARNIRVRTRFIAGRKAFTLARLEHPMAKALGVFSCSIVRRSKSLVSGR